MTMNWLAVTVICLWVGVSHSMLDFPVSGEHDACTTMRPPSNHTAKNTTSPFKVTVTTSKYCANSTVTGKL